MVRKLTAAAALATLAASCAPETQTPVKVRALVRSSNGEYVPQEVELKTVTDIVSLEGQVVRLLGGANVRLDANDPELQAATTEEALQAAIVKKEGRPVTASYIADDKGVLWPADFHTWNLVTTYYNFERAYDYFRTVAEVKAEELPRTTAYYFPDFVLAEASDKPQRDNAIFFAPAKAFLVLPFEKIEQAPLAINASILAHEYAHLVFNRRAYGGRGVPEPIGAWSATGGTPTPGLNVLKSLDEGLADFHAYGASCQSAFGCSTRLLETSFEGTVAEDRDLSKNWCMSRSLREQLLYSNFATFSGREYQVGTILASALYKSARSPADRQVLLRAVAATYSDTDPAKPGFAQLARAYLGEQQRFTLARAVRAIVQHIPRGNTALKDAVCTNFRSHLQIPVEELSGVQDGTSTQDDCPASTPVTSACESINP
ncbi:hypothetical protein [Archangium sp.]|jgi:hypothetical protein|uniref:hypothetical protein n=1 Tax=Archangium sp. TaxID=1872627 RepID=UPI002ED9DC6D